MRSLEKTFLALLLLSASFVSAPAQTPIPDAIAAPGGFMKVPQGPGLGIDVDEGVIARYRVA